jgi:hypothetical protein
MNFGIPTLSLKASSSSVNTYSMIIDYNLHNLENSVPWFVSVGNPVNSTGLASLLGYDHEKGISFLCSMGLIR